MKTSVIERLKEFLKHLELGQNIFEKRMGWGNGYIAHIKKSIGSDKLNDLINEYPLLNIEWLITGNGNMLKEEKQNNISIASDSVPKYGIIANKSIENTNLEKYNMDYKEKYYEQLEIVNELRERIDYFQREKLEVKNEPTGAGGVVTPARVG